MRPTRSLAAGMAAAAISATALCGALGGGTATAAAINVATVSPAVTGVSWHPLSLRNGWSSDNSLDGNGNPRWALKNGIVYLSGSLHQSSGSSLVAAVLPKAARPARVLFVTDSTSGYSVGHLDVDPDGRLVAESLPTVNAQIFTSLAGISYPAASVAGHKLTLLHGWQSSQGSWHTGDPSYSVIGGVVHLSGGLLQPVSGNSQFAVLSKAARPAHMMYLVAYTNNFTTGSLLIYPDGRMYAFGSAAQVFTSLAAISYPVRTVTWHKLKLMNGWTSGIAGAGAPSYVVIGGVVYLSGSLHQLTGSNFDFTVLPRGARPVNFPLIKAYTDNGLQGVVGILHNGTAGTYGSVNSQLLTSLAGIAYPVNS